MVTQLEPWPHRKGASNVAVKLLLCSLLIGLSLRLFFTRSATPVPVAFPVPAERQSGGDARPNATEDAVASAPMLPLLAVQGTSEDIQKESCDLFSGEWVPDPLGPAYTNASCRFIESPQNCETNGRPDTGYLYWKWKPYGCDLPPFDGEKFLDSMRGKNWALIGDSILRNHVQSLICLLSKIEDPVEVYHDATYKSRRWHFRSHNFKLSLVWAPFLIRAEIFENDDGVSTSELQLHLDTLDTNWTKQWDSFDYVVISTGQWFFKTAVYWENGKVIGCHYCKDKNLTEISVEYPFQKALEETYKFIIASSHKPTVFYRTWAPSHFENGEWSSGGTCNRTMPFKRGETGDRDMDYRMRRIEIEEFKTAVENNGLGNAGHLKLLDTFELSLLRPDGHPGPYRTYHPFKNGRRVKVQNDCLHWCLPGPIDAWNNVMMQLLAKE